MSIIIPITLAAWLAIVFWADASGNKPYSKGNAMQGKSGSRIKQVLSAAERSGSTAVAKRPVRFVGGILVVAVPAYFTFVPPVAGTTGWPTRILIMTGWLLVLVFAVFIASAHDVSIDRLAAWARGARTTFREAAAGDILKRLLSPADTVALGYTWALYVPDKRDRNLLIPLPQLGRQEANKWRVGTGVTGTAYATEQVQIGRDGDLKPGGRFEPQPGQSPHLQEYRTVVAQPIINASRQVLGVLTAATITDRRELLNEEGRALLAGLATDISRVLIDMLGFQE
jgi:hypothetical protein